MFLVINDIIPTKEKLLDKKIRGTTDNKCNHCGKVDSVEHRFKSCGNSYAIWNWIRDTIKNKLKICINDPVDMLGRIIENNQYQSKVALWLTLIGIAYNLKTSTRTLQDFVQIIREIRWNNRKQFEHSFNRWINVI